MKRLERYMPIAIDVVEDLILHKYDRVDAEWDNLVCKFGILVCQVGLLPAIAKYNKDSDISKVSKILLTHCLLRIILTDECTPCNTNDTLYDWYKANKSNPLIKSKTLDASIALKLAFRLFMINVNDDKYD